MGLLGRDAAAPSTAHDFLRGLGLAGLSGEPPYWHPDSRTEEIVEIGQPHRPRDFPFKSAPTLVVPVRRRFASGKEITRNHIIMFRDVGLEESCLIIGFWNR